MMKCSLLKSGKFIFPVLSIFFLYGCSGEDTPKPKEEEKAVQAPIAKDDSYTTGENQELKIEDLLENDVIYTYGRVKEYDATTQEGGSVVKNTDGTFTYTPPTDFMGTDSFEYTLCDAEIPANCSTAKVEITVTDAGDPVANHDTYQATENTEFDINNYLQNDDLRDGASLSDFNVEDTNGTVIKNEDGSFTYKGNNGFTGEDSFTYTICDTDETPSCSTATITINVIDEGSPNANDDRIVMNSTAVSVTIDNVLDNDNPADDAVIAYTDDSGSKGTAVLNGDGTITYTPSSGFLGEDTFSYTICDDDSTPTCVSATVTVNVVEAVSFNIPSGLQSYYSEVSFTQDRQLLFEILSDFTTVKHVNQLEYYQRHDYLYDADEDPDNPDNVILIYSGESRPEDEYWTGDLDPWETFNTEHIYPQSKLSSEEAKNDMHHMRSADIDVNEMRSYHPFTSGSGDYKLVDGNKWYPGDDWRGDVARMVMYVNLRYGEDFDDVGSLELFLEWNVEDPVSPFELQRNNVIEAAQGNRNPFIDNPYLATMIWGGDAAENLWE